MPPEPKLITFSIDGIEVHAPDGEFLVDAAKRGDIEIPFFCYEKKLVDPVGACRMCMVEIEGIPKLQTSCSTPVKDGMVVYTQTDRVKAAQESVVEFLLVNHPLDCPVCDKGGECPLQDITFGWGPGNTRVIDQKRNFPKPIALSPLVAIDRERCILCYRCVRFSQEVAEDYQLTFLERGDHTFVGTFDGKPYVAPFSGNIVELCPVGALTSTAYRFRARPWDIEQSGSVCMMCPSQCNVSFTVRDDVVERVLARENEDVDNGWLCDKGRYAYQSINSEERITTPLIRDGGFLRPVSWERALEAAVNGLKKAGGDSAAIVGGQTTNEEGYLLQRIFREALDSPNIDSRGAGTLDAKTARWMAAPERSAKVADIDDADLIVTVATDLVNESPILDLRVRKALRHFGAKLIVASDVPTALDGGADEHLLCAPGDFSELFAALNDANSEAGKLIAAAENVVVIWGERIGSPAFDFDAKLLEVPNGSNARGLREVGCLPNMLPGLAGAPVAGRNWRDARDGGMKAFYLLHSDPLRELPGRGKWDAALGKAFVVAHAEFLNESVDQHADVVFPAEAYAEKEGTVTHPDGRLQRVRPAVGRPDEVQREWEVLTELARRLGLAISEHFTSAAVYRELSERVPFYDGISLDEIGGDGLRWSERELPTEVQAVLSADHRPAVDTSAPPSGDLVTGTRRSLWTTDEVDNSPVLDSLRTEQELLVNPADAERLGFNDGQVVVVSSGDRRVEAFARVTARAPQGVTYLFEGTTENNPNALFDDAAGAVEVKAATGAAV